LLSVCNGCAQLPPTVVPSVPGTDAKAVVFDIDGTLTPDVTAVFDVREDAAEAVRAYATKGYKIVYLSTRVSWLSGGLPDWLRDCGFPEGSVHVAQTRNERERPDLYKTEILRSYVAQGWSLAYAYGDSSTDLAAYAAAGIPDEHVFALRRRGESECQPGIAAACLDGWTEHLEFVSGSVSNAVDP
jgi:phosphatidate phosphatase PAH1